MEWGTSETWWGTGPTRPHSGYATDAYTLYLMLFRLCYARKELVKRYGEIVHTKKMAKIVKISYDDQVSSFRRS